MGLRDGIPSLQVFAGTISGANVQTTNLSGVSFNSLSGVNITVTGSYTDTNSRIFVPSAGSPAGYNVIIQTGSAATSAGSLGFVPLGQGMPNFYYVTFAGDGYTAGVGSIAAWTSGTKHASGVNFVGGASTLYNWIAVGR